MILETFGDQLITVQELNQLTLANLWKTNQRVSHIQNLKKAMRLDFSQTLDIRPNKTQL